MKLNSKIIICRIQLILIYCNFMKLHSLGQKFNDIQFNSELNMNNLCLELIFFYLPRLWYDPRISNNCYTCHTGWRRTE